jgi:uncharacterized coiled-coil protein SlyX
MGAQVFFSAVTAMGVVIFAVAQWRNGRYKVDSDAMVNANNTIDILNKRIGAQEDRIKELQLLSTTQKEELARMDERVKLYKEVFQNRNPEMVEFIKHMTSSSDQTVEHMKSINETLKSISHFMDSVNDYMSKH